ncbi:hypothetical protein A8950_1773 [Dongia mobilis]|uniref:Oxidoreductase molybdopterin-binding domain-containing protein n=1 Tax=Dongia mobilis TaxID=578943 RepID=A0A4R6WM76_9PROT|nr:molybdopterin-dependent oxidoreductase [Dongia mobilis]TDQ81953.1 hypothetical protein A8950_1773 [Dongia mobilis]
MNLVPGRAGRYAVPILLSILLLALLPVFTAAANPLPAPSGPVILTIEGGIAHSNTADGKAALDLAMLESLPARTIETTTPWTEGPQTFTGVLLADLLAHVGASGDRLHAIASNDYEVTFPAGDVTDYGGILAYQQNGAALPSDKGPLWIVYDYDSDPQLLGDRFQSASIWNLVTLAVR